MTVPHPSVGTLHLESARELLALGPLPMSDNDTPQHKVTAQALFNRVLFGLAKYHRAHEGRNPACIQLNAQAFSMLQPTPQREWLHLTNDGWMFYDIPVVELPDQVEPFVFRD